MSLICLKWSRSQRMALSGFPVRVECATIRFRLSRSARVFGRPVSASVAALISATARLRRLTSTGAACETDSTMRSWSDGSSWSACSTRTEPITSPPTSEGTHVDRLRSPQRPHESSGSLSLDCECARPSRTERHAEGADSASLRANVDCSSIGVVASRRFWLLLRFRTVTSALGSERSRWRLTRACASSSLSVTCSVSANSRCDRW
jgi:hypothetical protein